jgi:hypothetical protein
MFPNGWPGRGLLLLRCVAGFYLIHDGVRAAISARGWEQVITPSILLASGTLLLLGLWTPVVGVLVVIAELWMARSTGSPLRSCVLLATLGAALAMLGPGVRSIDARIFGRKRIAIGDR